MKVLLTSGRAPARSCEFCLIPMKFLGEQAHCRIFRCDDCALVSTEPVAMAAIPENAFPPRRSPMWR